MKEWKTSVWNYINLWRDNLAEDSKEYDEDTVQSIVKRLKGKYKERGYSEEEKEEPESLRERIERGKEAKISEKEPKDLRGSKNIAAKITGYLYTYLGFLEIFSKKLLNLPFTQTLQHDLKSAYMPYNPDQYSAIAFVMSLFGTVIVAAFVLFIGFLFLTDTITIALLTIIGVFIGFFVSCIVTLQYPSNTASKRGREIDKVLAFGLRHMATEVKAGLSIHKAMKSIAKADYGPLSEEFQRTLDRIEKGVSTRDALEEMSNRAPSDDLKKALSHIQRTLRTGGKLSRIIETIADDVAFELRMKTRDFVGRLNLIGLGYMMVGVIAPVFVSILAGIFNAIPRVGMAGVLGVEILFLIYFILIPMMLGLILYVIKVMQPM